MRNIFKKLGILIILLLPIYFISYTKEKFDRNKKSLTKETCSFQSTELGIGFDYSCNLGGFSEVIYPANPQNDIMPYENWRLQRFQNNSSLFYIDANNKNTATYKYEGANVLEYYGQPLKDLCNDKSFIDSNSFKIEKISCKNLVNKNGLEYVKFEIELSSLYQYGYNNDSDSVIDKFITNLLPKEVLAQNIGDIFKVSGVFLISKSNKFPGVSMYAYLYDFPNNEGGRIDYLKGMKEIEKIIPTLRYTDNATKTKQVF